MSIGRGAVQILSAANASAANALSTRGYLCCRFETETEPADWEQGTHQARQAGAVSLLFSGLEHLPGKVVNGGGA
jgi:hypothetical protein